MRHYLKMIIFEKNKQNYEGYLNINNFTETLPVNQSKIASETLKDPYNFDFLGLHDDALEREIEIELTKNTTNFLLELGKGFAFLGRQYKIEISDSDYFIDLVILSHGFEMLCCN